MHVIFSFLFLSMHHVLFKISGLIWSFGWRFQGVVSAKYIYIYAMRPTSRAVQSPDF